MWDTIISELSLDHDLHQIYKEKIKYYFLYVGCESASVADNYYPQPRNNELYYWGNKLRNFISCGVIKLIK